MNQYAASAGGSQEILRLGSSGEAVVDLQGRLLKAGFYKDKIDGRYGAKTVEAVKLFQKSMGLAADGIVGPKTWAAMSVDKKPGSLLPVIVADSKRKPGLNDDGTAANDMRYGDYTQDQIENLSFMFQVDDFTVGLDKVSAKTLFDSLRFMSTTLFAKGDLEGNIQRMVDRFESNTGAAYSDAILTSAVREHASTKRFVEQIRKALAGAIKNHNGDISKLTKNLDVKLIGRPVFNTKEDIVSGLTIAINDTWAYKVAITSYELSGKRYKGNFSVTLYDHFGLDQPDVEKFYKFGAGFRAWFILQHLKRFAYKPFITEAEMTYSFEGQLP
ncbi:DUF3289 family protein [Archangium sp.]|uniref:DUF3289 family protein n=1 Tax=Archangium sp. TaxID=1872627 RepID=UPI00389AE720